MRLGSTAISRAAQERSMRRICCRPKVRATMSVGHATER
jgi:hypothetical protein